MFKFLCIPVRDFLVPSFPPLQDSPLFFALQGIFPVSSLLSSSLPTLRPYQSTQLPPSSSVWPFIVRPSEVFRPPADGRPMSSPVFLSSVPYAGLYPPPPPVRLVVLGLGVGGGAKETAPPAMVWSPLTHRQATPGSACRLRRSSSLFDSCGARLSVCPPPPPCAFPRTTVLVPILSLLTEEYFRDRSVRPCYAGPGRPGGCFYVSGPLPCPPPPPSLFHGHLFWVA